MIRLTDEEIEQLPEEPELAFIEFEKILRTLLNVKVDEMEQQNNNWTPNGFYLEYINQVLAAAKHYEIENIKDFQVPKAASKDIYGEFHQLTTDIDHLITQIKLRRVPRNRQNSVGLDGNTKARIHNYIQKIRIILIKAELPEPKRDALFTKLEAFALEVDKTRTSLQSITAVWLTVSGTIGEGVARLEPVIRLINSIAVLIGKAKASETLLTLPYPTRQLELESLQKQLPPPDSSSESLLEDEETPF